LKIPIWKAVMPASLWILSAGCGDECVTTLDCGANEKCVDGECKASTSKSTFSTTPTDIEQKEDDSDATLPITKHDSDSDDTDTYSEMETDTGPLSPALCTGDNIWYDHSTGLCWYKGFVSLGRLMFYDAEFMCQNVATDQTWRMPAIQELYTLIYGCNSGKSCALNDPDCLSMDCRDDCPEDACEPGEGPTDGCYMRSSTFVSGACGHHWSASHLSTNDNYVWVVVFDLGWVQDLAIDFSWGSYLLCVFDPEEDT
jgi:hypothetical protein